VEPLADLEGGGRHGVRVADVEGDDGAPPAGRRDQLVQLVGLLRLAGAGHDLVPGGQQLPGEFQPETAVRPGHDHSAHVDPLPGALRLSVDDDGLEEPWAQENLPPAGGVSTTWR